MPRARRWLILLAVLILAFLLIAPSRFGILDARTLGPKATVQPSPSRHDEGMAGGPFLDTADRVERGLPEVAVGVGWAPVAMSEGGTLCCFPRPLVTTT